MTTSPFDAQNCLPTLPAVSLGTLPLVACLHCGATQATVRRDRQILDARLGYPSHCACCECETDNACPKCRGENLEYGTYDSATDRETGYADFGERYYCRDCGTTGDVDDTVAVLARAREHAGGVVGGGVMKTVASAGSQTGSVSLETKYLHLRQPVPLGHRMDGWRVCWLGGWDKQRVFFVVMVVRVQP